MRVLLTGATGFVGSHLLDKLIKLNIPVAIILRSESNTWRIKEYMNKATLIQGDLSNPQLIETAILDFAPDTCIHMAWYGVENRFRNEYQQLTANLTQVSNLLEILEKAGVKKLIGFGSQGEYGPHSEPIAENLSPKPTTFYGIAKLCAYQIMNLFSQQRNMEFAWIRLFSIYGPKDNDSWLIPTVIKDILQQTSPSLTEGKQFWDFLYIDDAIEAIVNVLTSPHCHGIFNLGSGCAVTIKQVVEKIRDIINPAVHLGFGLIPYRSDQVMFLEAKIDRINHLTGWAPQIHLEEGLKRTIAWYQ